MRDRIRFLTCALFLLTQVVGPMRANAEDDIYDRFYDDDTTATWNFLGGAVHVQIHNFWEPDDADWVKFNVDSDRPYSIQVQDQAPRCDAIIYLYHESNLTTALVVRDDWGPGGAVEEINWYSDDTSGTIYILIKQSAEASGLFGEETTYTLRVSGDWGGNAGLATISGTTRLVIGPPGGLLRVPSQTVTGDQITTHVYTKHQVYFAGGVLDLDRELIIEAPDEDIDTEPEYDSTRAWLAAHPGNASLVRILTGASTISLAHATPLTVQFVNDGPTTNGFTIDDLPPGANPSRMRIHTWTGSEWRMLEGPQAVVGDTVIGWIGALGDVASTTGYGHMSLFGAAPAAEEASRARDWRLYR